MNDILLGAILIALGVFELLIGIFFVFPRVRMTAKPIILLAFASSCLMFSGLGLLLILGILHFLS